MSPRVPRRIARRNNGNGIKKPRRIPSVPTPVVRNTGRHANAHNGVNRNGIHGNTKYQDIFPQLLVEHMREGNSFETFGNNQVLVSVKTLYEWVKNREEFSKAKQIGQRLSQEWWERMGKAILTDDVEFLITSHQSGTAFLKKRYTKFNGEVVEEYHVPRASFGMWIFNMKNRFGWRDITGLEHTGKDGGPIQSIKKPDLDLSKLSDDQLRQFRELALAARPD